MNDEEKAKILDIIEAMLKDGKINIRHTDFIDDYGTIGLACKFSDCDNAFYFEEEDYSDLGTYLKTHTNREIADRIFNTILFSHEADHEDYEWISYICLMDEYAESNGMDIDVKSAIEREIEDMEVNSRETLLPDEDR